MKISGLEPLTYYAVGLLFAALAVAVVAFNVEGTLRAPVWAVVLLAVFALLAERQPVRITANAEMTVSVLPVVFMAVAYGPLEAMLVGAVAMSGDFKRPYTRWTIWTAFRCLAGGLGGLGALAVLSQGRSFGALLGAVAIAVSAEALIDGGLGSLVVKFRGGSAISHVRETAPVLATTIPLYTAVIFVLCYAYLTYSPWSALLFFGPAFAAHRLYRLYWAEREGSERLKEVNTRLERANLSFATALVATLDARDRYTAGHSAAVAVYARDIAIRMDLDADQQQLAHLCGLVHDIGKIGLPAGLLEKPGALTLEERRQMETHSEIGERILAKVDQYAQIATIVRHHHERIDGTGYPDQLPGDEIPIISKIIGVADAYNAMTSDRPYRDAMPSRVARLRLAQAVESQFDTSVVAAFEAILASSGEDYRSGARADFTLDAQHYAAESTAEAA